MRALYFTLFSLSLIAQDSSLVTVLNRVRVYPDKAWTNREATCTLTSPGSHRFLITGLPQGLSLDDIRVHADGIPGLRLGNVSVVQQENSPQPDAAATALNAETERLKAELADIQRRKDALQDVLNALGNLKPEASANDKLGSSDSKANLELCRVLQERQESCLHQQEALTAEAEKIEAHLGSIDADVARRQVNLLKNSSTACIELEVPKAGDVRIQIENQTQAARWRPAYEVRFDTSTKNLELLCYASVSQASDEDWRGVSLEISNAEPGRRFSLPSSPPPVQLLYEAPGIVAAGRIEGRVTDRNGRPLGGVHIQATCQALKQQRSVTSDANGVYRIMLLPAGEYLLQATKSGLPSTSGYARVLSGQATSLGLQMLQNGGTATVEVVATMASESKSDDKISVNFSSERLLSHPALDSTPSHYEEAGEFGRAWTLSGRRDLPSDALPRRILLARESSPPCLRLMAIPRSSSEVFLVAAPKLTAGFPMFPGTPTTVFQNGERLGQINLPRLKAGDGATFSFGPVSGLRSQRQRLEATVATLKGGRGRQWTLRERVILFNDTDRDVDVEVQEPALHSASDRIHIDPLPSSTPVSSEVDGLLVWRIKVPAKDQARIEEGWRIFGPNTGSVPELSSLGLPTSD